MAHPSLKVLLVDDEKNIRQTLLITLKNWGHDVTTAETAEDGIKALRKEGFDFLLTDFRLEKKNGIDLVKTANSLAHPPVSVLMTAFASFENAVNAVKEGAFDYLPKPFSNSQLEHLMNRVSAIVELKRENQKLRSLAFRSDFFEGQSSPAIQRLEEFVRKVSPTEANILLSGESGTGKTELARVIHSRSPRNNKDFVVVNCTTIAESLLESELFGHAKGAFTGAVQDHVGKLELANHGTVFIDEVGDLSLNGQTRLLRFLQEKIIERVGSNKQIPLDVRVIAATNKNLEEAVREGKFREDLYFRLNIFECQLVPLRFRSEDIPILIQRFLKEFSVRGGLTSIKSVADPVMKKLLSYRWPGNVRELKNTVERLVLLSEDREMSVSDLPESIQRNDQMPPKDRPVELKTLEDVEREHIERILSFEQNQENAAKILGITTVTLWRKRKQYGLP
jgi:NtrC-family two-component system response regulator AlgB